MPSTASKLFPCVLLHQCHATCLHILTLCPFSYESGLSGIAVETRIRLRNSIFSINPSKPFSGCFLNHNGSNPGFSPSLMTMGVMDGIRHKGCTSAGQVANPVSGFGFAGMSGLPLQILPKWQFGMPSSRCHEWIHAPYVQFVRRSLVGTKFSLCLWNR